MIEHVTIVGNGAIGQLWAHYLTNIGCHVSLVGRTHRSNTTFKLSTLDDKTLEQTITYLVNQLPMRSDLVLVTTKSYQIVDAITPYLAALTNCPIVLMHNGLGTAEKLVLADQHQIYLATTSQAALQQADQVKHTGLGPTVIGCFRHNDITTGHQITNLLARALSPVEFVTDIEGALWRKLAINCVINPLTAINNCRNGALAQREFDATRDKVLDEICQLTTALNIELDRKTLNSSVELVIKNTANNYSSMHQDIKHQRASEIDFINGYVVRCGAQLGIATPENKKLVEAINRLAQFND